MTRLRSGLAVWAGWTTLALFFAISTSLTYRSTGRAANWQLNIERALAEWWLWAALTPAVVGLARRFPVQGRARARNVAIHVGAGTLVAIAKTLADRAVFAWLTGFWTYLLVSTLALQFAIYAAVVAAAHGAGYYRRSREREHLEAQLARTRLQMLNMQLQPHFLFNTLNTIAEMVHEDPDKADEMIASLSELLRRTLDVGMTADVTLDEEIAFVEKYLDIQRIRFGDRLHAVIAATSDARAVRVPALLLQPLVENAIRHGVAGRVDAGRIDIEAVLDAASLIIDVTDDGGGTSGADPAGSRRLGLANTRERLDAAFGAQARLDLTPAPGRGMRVRIVIPR